MLDTALQEAAPKLVCNSLTK